jgi:hypothetical protein
MNSFSTLRAAVSLIAPCLLLQADTIHVRVVDGRNGQKITKERVEVWIIGTNGMPMILRSTAEFEAPAGSRINVRPDAHLDCRPRERTGLTTYSVEEIKRLGITTENTCGKLGSKANPGELLLFVQPLHWWEKLMPRWEP